MMLAVMSELAALPSRRSLDIGVHVLGEPGAAASLRELARSYRIELD